MSIKAMRQAIDALVQTDTHPISSAEQYFKEMSAMEALEDAIKDSIEQAEKNEFAPDWDTNEVLIERIRELESRDWLGLTEDEITELFCDYDASQFPKFVRTVEAKLKEKNAYGSQPINDPSEWLD